MANSTPPPPNGPYGPGPWSQEPPKKKRRKWPWILLAVFVLGLGGCVGALALLSTAAQDVAKDIETEQAEIQAEVEGCEVIDAEEFDPTAFTIRCTVTNSSADRSNYTWTVGATVDGQRYGTTTFFVDNLRSGESASPESTLFPDGDVQPPDPATIELEVFDVTRFSAEG